MFGTMLKPRAEAIWAGELVDVSALAQTQGWACPVMLTRAAHALVMEGADEGDGAVTRWRLRVVTARAHRKVDLAKTFGRLQFGVPLGFCAELSLDPDVSEVVVLAVVLTLGEDGPVATITLPCE